MNQPRAFVLSVSAGTGCYRHIAISANATLYQLHSAILEAFDFVDDHAHAFFLTNRLWSQEQAYFSPVIEGEELYTHDSCLNQVGLAMGGSFKYLFDFGAERVFQCKLLRSVEEVYLYPTLLRTRGDSPLQYPDFSLPEVPQPGTFPLTYSPGNLALLAEQVKLSQETIALLKDYFAAAARLYGIFTLRQLLDLYNNQNDPIEPEDFLDVARLERHSDRPYTILSEVELYADGRSTEMLDWELIDEALYQDGLQAYQAVRGLQQGKPYYVPSKDAFLQYSQPYYYEENPQSRALYQFLLGKVQGDEFRATAILTALQHQASLDQMDFAIITSFLLEQGVVLEGEAEVQTFIGLQMELSNSARKQVNRGHTPLDLSNYVAQTKAAEPDLGPALPDPSNLDFENDPEIQGLFQQIADMDVDEATRASMVSELRSILGTPTPVASAPTKKVGRNEPCPCGSGKKYKRCCGR